MKRCTKCREREGVVRFTKNKGTKDGKECRCVGCRRVDRREYYQKNKEKRIKREGDGA